MQPAFETHKTEVQVTPSKKKPTLLLTNMYKNACCFYSGTTNSKPAQISKLFKKLTSRIEMGALLWDKIENPR